MFNRTLLTTSANFIGLNLGTRSLALVAGGNNGGTSQRIRATHPYPRTEMMRLGHEDHTMDPSIIEGSWLCSSIPSSPAVTGRPLPVVPVQPRVPVVVELPPSLQDVVPLDAPSCSPRGARSARRDHPRQNAPKRAAQAANAGAKRRGEPRRSTTVATLTAPDAITASGG